MALIETTGLTQKYGASVVLKNVSLNIEKTEILTLVGPTGAGKTTLIRILDLIEPPYSGKLVFDGVDVLGKKSYQLEARRRMSYVQQRPLVFTMNVYDNIACGLKWRHIKSTVLKRKTEDALELVGMTGYRERLAKTLSGGETQRIAIARAMVTEPEVLFLDEPTANMDPISVAKIEEVLSGIMDERKMTIVMTTHNLLQAQRMASKVGVLINGELLQTGSVNDIFNKPHNREVAEFVGIENVITGVIREKDNGLAKVAIRDNKYIEVISECAIGKSVDIIIRPEDVTFSLNRSSTSARNNFSGIITKATLVGPLVRIEADCGFPLLGLVTKKSAEELNMTVGRQVYASIKVTAIRAVKALAH